MFRWTALHPDGLGWIAPNAGAGAVTNPLDPYLAWAAATGLRGFVAPPSLVAGGRGASAVTVVVKAKDHAQVRRLASEPWLRVARPYTQPLPGTNQGARHFTAQLQMQDLWRLRVAEGVERFELGLPLYAAGQPLQMAAPPAAVARAMVPEPPPQRAIGIIDYGCALLNRRFTTYECTRIVSLWDQGEPPVEAAWLQSQPALGYGRELQAPQINLLLQDKRSEEEVYRELGYLLDRADRSAGRLLRDTHGTHVMDLAAGPDNFFGEEGVADLAAQAPLLFVQLPLATALDASGGSLAAYVLDGLHHMLARCAPTARLVVNVSYGAHGGPHDGSALLEEAMDELIDLAEDRLVVVVSAGNGRKARGHWQQTIEPGQTAALDWRVPVQDQTDSFLELWYLPHEGLLVKASAPDGVSSGWLPSDQGNQLRNADGRCVAMMLHQSRTATGDGAMALLALAPTQGRANASDTAPDGVWRVDLHNTGKVAVEVHAFIEREDPALGQAVPSSRLIQGAEEACTLNGIATGRRIFSVGALRMSDGHEAEYSALGPTRDRRPAPVLFDIGEESVSMYGLRASAVPSGATFRMGGTSAAAPLAARKLYNQMG